MRKFFEAVQSITQRWLSDRTRPSATPRGRYLHNRLQRFEQLEQRTLLSISQGVEVLNIDDVLLDFDFSGDENDIRGTGIKVGVIANGVVGLDGSAAELPANINDGNHVQGEGSGKDGTAMLEVLHDVAPGAELYFSPASTAVEAGSAVTWLDTTADVDIIVFSAGIYEQPWFEDGTLTNAVQTLIGETADRTVVVSAAGDDGWIHYQGTADNEPPDYNLNDEKYLVFDVDQPGTVTAYLQWDDTWALASNDWNLWLYIWNNSAWEQVDSDTAWNGIDYYSPWAEVSHYYDGTGTTQMAVKVTRAFNSTTTSEIELMITGPVSDTTTTHTADDTVVDTPEDAIFGPAALTGVITVGTMSIDPATFVIGNPATYPTTVADDSSRGGSAVDDYTLDGVAIDNVNTTVYGTATAADPGFVGTSSAAAHVAGIAALMLQADPTLSVSLVHSKLTDTAVDLNSDGNDLTDYDKIGGYGRFDGLEAVYSSYTPFTPDLAFASDLGKDREDNITNVATPTIDMTVPADSYVWVYLDGNTTTPVSYGPAYGQSYIYTPSLLDGTYTYTIQVASSAAGAKSYVSAPLTIYIDTEAPAAGVPDLYFSSDTGLHTDDDVTKGSASGPVDERPRFTGAASDNTSIYESGLWKVEILENGALLGTQLTASNYDLTTGDLTEGNWTVTAKAYDVAGNSRESATGLPVVVDRTVPANVFVDLDDSTDSGVDPEDEYTNSTAPLFTLDPDGTGSGIASVWLAVNGGDYVYEASYDVEMGKYKVNIVLDEVENFGLDEGENIVEAMVTDVAGNVAYSPALPVTIDTQEPTVTIDFEEGPRDGTNPVEELWINFDWYVVRMDPTHLTLTLDGADIPLVDANGDPLPGVSLEPDESVGSEGDWLLTLPASLTEASGTYVLTLIAENGSGEWITDVAGNHLTDGEENVITWEQYGKVITLAGDDDVIVVTTTVTPDGTSYTVNGAGEGDGIYEVDSLYIDAGGGNDKITVTGTSGSETANLSPGTLELLGSGFWFDVVSVEEIHAYSGGGSDTANLAGSGTSGNWFTGRSTYSTLSGASYYQHVGGFDTVTATATPGVRNVAIFYGGDGVDSLTATPTSTTMDWGGPAVATANGFGTVCAYGSSGDGDTASLTGASSGNDRFWGRSEYSIMQSPSAYYYYASGFDTITAYVTAAYSNIATFYGGDGADALTVTSTMAKMDWKGPTLATANGFGIVYAYGSTGDSANMTAAATGGHTFSGRPDYSILNGPSMYCYAVGFDTVTANATSGVGNRAIFYSGDGVDSLTATPTSTTMDWYGPAVATANGFGTFYAYGSSGDTASLTGASGGNDRFWGRSAYSVMSSPSAYYYYASGFDEITANVTAAYSNIASFYGGDGADALTVTSTMAKMDWKGPTLATANGFGTVYAYGSTGDSATMTAAATGGHTFSGRPDHSILNGPSMYCYAVGFDTVTANAVVGTNNTAYFYDSLGKDTLLASSSTASITYESAKVVTANAFKQVYADFSNGEADTLDMEGSSGANRFVGQGHWGYLTDTSNSYYIYFSSLTATNDEVTIRSGESSGDDYYDVVDELYKLIRIGAWLP